MSEETTAPISKAPEEEVPEKVHVTSYPKIIFLWPTWALAFFIWLIAIIGKVQLEDVAFKWVGWLWFGILTFNIFVIAFEFQSATFLALIAAIFGVLIAFTLLPQLQLPNLAISGTFYLAYTLVFTAIFGLLWLSRRFNYLEITTQQISYHVGIMADERRYPAPSVHFEKKTEDIFERIIPPWCAKLVMKQEGGLEAETLTCVPRVNKRLSDIKKILEHIRVKHY